MAETLSAGRQAQERAQNACAEKLLTEAAGYLGATLAKSDIRAWKMLLTYCPPELRESSDWLRRFVGCFEFGPRLQGWDLQTLHQLRDAADAELKARDPLRHTIINSEAP
jgi:hypothetical protein